MLETNTSADFASVFTYFRRLQSTPDRNGDRPPDISTAFTAEIYIIRGEREYEAKYDQTSLAEAQLEFTSPATVRGLKVTLNGSKCTLDYGNLTFSADVSSLPQSGVESS